MIKVSEYVYDLEVKGQGQIYLKPVCSLEPKLILYFLFILFIFGKMIAHDM